MKIVCSPEEWKKSKKVFLVFCAIIVVIMIALCVAVLLLPKDAEKPAVPNPQNQGAAEFTGPAYKPAKVYDGTEAELNISDFDDKPMALIFFNTTNENSLEALKIFAEQESEYSEKVNIVAVCVIDGTSENPESVKEFLSDNKIELKNVVFDLDYTAKNEYKVSKIPTFVFVNKNKEIINTLEVDIDEDIITANLDILAENY